MSLRQIRRGVPCVAATPRRGLDQALPSSNPTRYTFPTNFVLVRHLVRHLDRHSAKRGGGSFSVGRSLGVGGSSLCGIAICTTFHCDTRDSAGCVPKVRGSGVRGQELELGYAGSVPAALCTCRGKPVLSSVLTAIARSAAAVGGTQNPCWGNPNHPLGENAQPVGGMRPSRRGGCSAPSGHGIGPVAALCAANDHATRRYYSGFMGCVPTESGGTCGASPL